MRRLTRPLWPVLGVSLLLSPAWAAGQPPSSGTPMATQQATAPAAEPPKAGGDAPVIDSGAMNTLKRMADTLAQAKGFRVTIRSNYDVVQDTGETIEFGERRTVTLTRPDALRVEAQQSDGKTTLVSYDGKAITVFNPDRNVYGQVDEPGSVDDAIHSMVQDLQVRVPLALLLVTTLPAELDQRIQALDYVERDTLTPVPTDHLAARTEDADFQVWIAGEGTPLPQRITITYKNDEGEPQYRAELTDWALNPEVAPAQLAVALPAGAERIPFLIRVPRAKSDQPPATTSPPQTKPGPSGSAEGAPK
ncbi:DUF2092 domain-containing protein [Azospirillum canadense]|uniref:DUF2092 domain-containing protein n=1 Tax=Azospirillum canadense TaxID=403962 RepID=UPI0022267746|nr:DUF2092 domain-containing protein [Azospirillum canadense]MCW2239160.1 hypothetical protein [Azospirillum canadense]